MGEVLKKALLVQLGSSTENKRNMVYICVCNTGTQSGVLFCHVYLQEEIFLPFLP